MKNRKKLKKEFVGAVMYIPRKTVLSDNMTDEQFNVVYKLNSNLFESVSVKKNNKLQK